ncbi:PREDICTED: protein CutA isoform X1 [Myotis brandtii]|uniref:protein CutA isoform X1 n=1 Tax=Myotis brandtii TaxID=109478 RepID=UPI0007047A16|nr:PREDICTED: protein CutA isoform X1 [Myotis brandtii]
MRRVRAPAVLLGGGVSERPRPSRFGSLDHHPHPNPRVACGLWGDTEFSACSQAALLLSLLWMPALLPVASRLLSLPRALTAMASGSPPAQPSPAADSGYVPGSVSAAFVTCPNEKVAKEIARAVVEKRLAACVNLIPQITSIYEWKGKIEEDSEVLMMIKTPSSLVPALTDFVRSVHPYEVAEVISLPVEQGNSPYLRWVRQVTEAASDPSTVPP